MDDGSGDDEGGKGCVFGAGIGAVLWLALVLALWRITHA
jgi:hypothetical protein